MKKVLVTLLIIVSVLALTACNSLDTSLQRSWLKDGAPSHEKLTYKVETTGGTSTTTGTYTSTVTRLQANLSGDSKVTAVYNDAIKIHVIDKDAKTESEITGTEKSDLITALSTSGATVLETSLDFDGDKVDVVLIMNSNYKPVRVFKKFDAKGDVSPTDEDHKYVSYVYSAVYSYDVTGKCNGYTANVLRRSADGFDGYEAKVTENLDGKEIWDTNQIIYIIRNLKLAQSNFTYSYSEPAPLDDKEIAGVEASLKTLGVSVASNTTDINVKGKLKSSRQVNLSLRNSNISGTPISIYCAVEPIKSDDEIVTLGASVSLSTPCSLDNVPLKISQGNMIYTLTGIDLY